MSGIFAGTRNRNGNTLGAWPWSTELNVTEDEASTYGTGTKPASPAPAPAAPTILSAAAAQQAGDMLKDCSRERVRAAKYQDIAYGPVGPQTCWLANTVYSDGCQGKSQVAAYCAARFISMGAPGKVSDTTLRVGQTTGGQAVTQLQEQRASSSGGMYPAGTFSANTQALQRAVNAFGAKMVAEGKWGSYCQIKEDGKLGPGTCGAIKAASDYGFGTKPPSTCTSYSGSCSGTIVGKSGSAPVKPTTYVPPMRPSVAVTPTEPPIYEEESLLDKIGGLTTVIMGGAIAVALGIVGFAVAKKKGLIGKKVKSNRRRRCRRNAHTEVVPGWQGERTATMPGSGRHKGSVLVGSALQSLKDEMRHEGMSAADRSARSGHGVSAKARDAAWKRASASVRSAGASARLPALRDAFESGWNTRARAMGYVANRRRRRAA